MAEKKSGEEFKNTTCTRQEFCWHFASLWIESLGILNISDEGFTALLRKLSDYVAEKLESGITGDIEEMYMIVEHKK